MKTEFEALGVELPIMISGTITDASGRTLSGQTTEAFYNSLRHAEALTFGLNCALGPDELRQYVQELSRIAECYVTAHPNAGLPNAFGEYDLDADTMAKQIREWAQAVSQYRRRLLWHHATTYCSDESCSRRISAAQTAGNPRSLPFVRPGAAEHWRR